MKYFAASFFLALALASPTPAQAQSAAQWSQLVAYVSKLANRMLAQEIDIVNLEAQNAAHKNTINQLVEALDQERCRIGRTITYLKAATAQEPTAPMITVDNVACKDLTSPVPPFPEKLP